MDPRDNSSKKEEFLWLLDKLTTHIMHEDDLLDYRTSFFVTATSIFVAGYSLSLAYQLINYEQGLVFRIAICVVGIIFGFGWEGAVVRTQKASELWKDEIKEVENMADKMGLNFPDRFKLYSKHAEKFRKRHFLKSPTHGISTKLLWKIIPSLFLILWVVLLASALSYAF